MSTITLTVTAYKGQASDGSLHADFDETGGTIGRAETNQLVLPDPDRSISRVHAQIVFRSGRYALIDRGSNPVLVNGQAGKSDAEVTLREGDRVMIGGYEIKVGLGQAASRPAPAFGAGLGASAVGSIASAADPFADLLGPAPARVAKADGPGALPDPLAGLDRMATPVPAAPIAARTGGAAAPAALPEDWNPFAPGASSAPPPSAAPLGLGSVRPGVIGLDTGSATPAPLIPDMANNAGAESLDALFGLHSGQPVGPDPLAMSALAQPMAQPNMAAHADPLRSLGSAPQATSETRRDTVSDLSLPFSGAPPQPRRAIDLPPVAVPAAMGDAAPAPIAIPMPAAPIKEVLSWESPPSSPQTIIRAGTWPADAVATPALAVAPAAPAAPSADAADWGGADPLARPAPTLPSAASATAAAAGGATVPAVASADMAALCQAFCEGLDTPDIRVDALTPELMKLIGVLLREATAGTVDMLLARAALKRELKATATTIRARENNPLKFSPSAEVALRHLLAPPARGFIGGGPAMRDAYIDLRAHQFGMVAGMRAALDGVLDRFDPGTLEGRLAQRSALQSLLPGGRKARLWDVFVEHYGQIRSEAADDFHTLFGTAFLKAYDEHTAQLDKERP